MGKRRKERFIQPSDSQKIERLAWSIKHHFDGANENIRAAVAKQAIEAFLNTKPSGAKVARIRQAVLDGLGVDLHHPEEREGQLSGGGKRF